MIVSELEAPDVVYASRPPQRFSHEWKFAHFIASIVFVHGLNGHRTESWTSDKKTNPPSVFWPEKLLVEDCPTARIMMYGYDASLSLFMTGPGHPIDLFRAGQDLINCLVTKRRAGTGELV